MLLPDNSITETSDVSVARQPNKTYRMQIEEEHIGGPLISEIRAVEQAVYKIINTERYRHVIYSWNYGVELSDLFGKPIPYVLPEIPRRIREALIQDDRIDDVTEFDLKYDKRGNVTAKFTVNSIYGDISMTTEVKIA